MKKLIISLMAIGTMTTSLQADNCVVNGCFGIEKLIITKTATRIYTTGNEKLLSCKTFMDKAIVLDVATPNYQAMYSTLLSSQMKGNNVFIHVLPDTSGNCAIEWVTSLSN